VPAQRRLHPSARGCCRAQSAILAAAAAAAAAVDGFCVLRRRLQRPPPRSEVARPMQRSPPSTPSLLNWSPLALRVLGFNLAELAHLSPMTG